MIVPDLTRPESVVLQIQSPESEGAQKLQTFGPTQNERTTTYARNGAAHNLVGAERVSADLMLGHGARVAGFYRRLSQTPALDPASRATRDRVLRTEVPFVASAPAELQIVSPVETTLAGPLAVPAQLGGFGVSGFGVYDFGT